MSPAPGALELMARDLPALCLRLDEAGRAVEANAFTRGLCGGAPGGRPLAALLVEAQRPGAEALLAEAARASVRLTFAGPGGALRTFVTTALPIGGGWLLAGAEDQAEARDAAAEQGRINQALAHTTRELQKANARLAQIGAAQLGALDRAAARLAATAGWLEALEREGLAGTLAISPGEGAFEGSPAWWALHGLAGGAPAPWREVAARLEPPGRAALEAAARLSAGGAGPVRLVYQVPGAAGARRVLLVAWTEPAPGGGAAAVRGFAVDATAAGDAG